MSSTHEQPDRQTNAISSDEPGVPGLSAEVLAAVAATYSAIPADPTIEQLREGLDAVARSIPDGVEVAPVEIGGVGGLMITPSEISDTMILYLHGGGWICGSSTSHRDMVARIAESARCRAFLPDYRLSPEAKFPAALEDVIACWVALASEELGESRLVVMGDSAGGNLALASVFAAREAGLPAPVGVVAISPVTDLALATESMSARAERDPIVVPGALQEDVEYYMGEQDISQPLASPINGAMNGYPPLLLHVGSEEVLFDDSLTFAQRLKNAGGSVRLEIKEGMPHVYTMMWAHLNVARAGIADIATFTRSL